MKDQKLLYKYLKSTLNKYKKFVSQEKIHVSNLKFGTKGTNCCQNIPVNMK